MKKIFSLFFLLIAFQGNAQKYFAASQEEFGQNRIQLRRLEWKTIYSNNFEFNYYRGGDALAEKAAKMAESEYNKITEILGYTPFTTMKVFLYNTPAQMDQSNIGLTSPINYDGGILNLARSRIEIAYENNDSLFNIKLIKEISGLFVYDMLYGGSLKEVLQSSLLLTVPEWYMSGIAAYISEDNSNPEVISKMKEAILRNQDKKLNSITGADAELIGQSIWNYIALKYNRDNISNILNLTRIIRAEQSSITSTLGISFNRFIKDWQSFYLNGNNLAETSAIVPKSEIAVSKITDSSRPPRILKEGEVNTDNYTFDEESIKAFSEKNKVSQIESSSTFNQSKLRKYNENLTISAPKAYQNQLITNDLRTEFFNDPVRKIGMKNSIMINDLLENHVIKFGLFITPSLRNHDMEASYHNFEKRLDWGFNFRRRAINLEDIDYKNHYLFRPLHITLPPDVAFPINRKLFMHTYSLDLSYPLSKNLKVQFSPAFISTADIDLEDISKNILKTNYGSLNSELVYDNTVSNNLGVLVGTRAKVSLEKNVSFGNNAQNFGRLNFDLRHYQKLLNGLQLAGRFNYGRSSGNSPKYAFIGGAENTLNRKIQPASGQIPGVPGDLRDLLFYNFPGNLRGFDFAKLYGNNFLLFNLELRLNLAQYFPSNSITSSFIKNLQFVLFDDIGTAWNGNKGPLSRQNSLNTEVIGGGSNPFYAEVTNFKNPFLMGYGIGVRTTILGFFVKADYGIGVENKETGTGKLYLSLGHDF